MKRLLSFVLTFVTMSLACAGGGDPVYVGRLSNGLQEFRFNPPPLSQATEIEVLSPNESKLKTQSIRLDLVLTIERVDPNHLKPEPDSITGCELLYENTKPFLLVCPSSVSNKAFRDAVYAFYGNRYATSKSKFVCISNCSKKIPRQFNLIVIGTGEDEG